MAVPGQGLGGRRAGGREEVGFSGPCILGCGGGGWGGGGLQAWGKGFPGLPIGLYLEPRHFLAPSTGRGPGPQAHFQQLLPHVPALPLRGPQLGGLGLGAESAPARPARRPQPGWGQRGAASTPIPGLRARPSLSFHASWSPSPPPSCPPSSPPPLSLHFTHHPLCLPACLPPSSRCGLFANRRALSRRPVPSPPPTTSQPPPRTCCLAPGPAAPARLSGEKLRRAAVPGVTGRCGRRCTESPTGPPTAWLQAKGEMYPQTFSGFPTVFTRPWGSHGRHARHLASTPLSDSRGEFAPTPRPPVAGTSTRGPGPWMLSKPLSPSCRDVREQVHLPVVSGSEGAPTGACVALGAGVGEEGCGVITFSPSQLSG